MNRKEELQRAYEAVLERVEKAKQKAGRTEPVTIVCVTKTYPVEDILMLYEMGHRDFGENKVQEIVRKKPYLPEDCRIHMIGSLQTNKVKQVLPNVQLIQSLDRKSLLEAFNKRAEGIVDTLLEVNIAYDDQKAGMPIEEVDDFLAMLPDYPMVRVKGIMGMGSHTDDVNQIREDFRRAKTLFEKLRLRQTEQIRMEILSIGMSNDFEIAIEEGANMVRIGSAILGERGYA